MSKECSYPNCLTGYKLEIPGSKEDPDSGKRRTI